MCNFVWVRMIAEKPVLKDKRPENTTNNQNLTDPATEKVKQKENATLTLKGHHENQREQNQNYVQLNWLGGLVVAVTPLWLRRGAGPVSPCRAVREWMRRWSRWHVSQEWRNRQWPKGQRQHPSFQECQYWLDWGLPKDARGSVSDQAEEVEEPEAAEVVARDLVWKL